MHIHLPFTGGFESACWFTNLSWHIAGFVTRVNAPYTGHLRSRLLANIQFLFEKFHFATKASLKIEEHRDCFTFTLALILDSATLI